MALKSPFECGTYRIAEPRRLRRAWRKMQTWQSLCCSHKWHANCQHEILVPLLHCLVTKAQATLCKCADSPVFAALKNCTSALINGTPITIWARKWDFSTLANLHIPTGSIEPSSRNQNLVFLWFVAFMGASSHELLSQILCAGSIGDLGAI